MNENLRTDLEAVFLIHRRAFRETSAILEIFSRTHGRLGLVARGVHRRQSPLRAALTSFVPLLMSWSGRGELATLRAVEVASVVDGLLGDALLSAMYINELLMRLTHRHDPHPELFDAYDLAIRDLGSGQMIEQTLRVFEKRILEAIGYGPILEFEADGGRAVLGNERYRYVADRGPTREPQPAGEYIEITGETLLLLAKEQPLHDAAKKEAKRLMRFLLAAHLGGRPLASRELFRR